MARAFTELNQQIFTVLARFIPHVDEKAPVERLQGIFPHFRDCLEKILQEESVYQDFYSLKFRLLFGQIVHSLLFIFEQKRNDKSIRLEAGRILCQIFDSTNKKCSDSTSVAYVLPGVVTKCAFLVRSEPSSQFVGTSLNIIQTIICSVFNDRLVLKLLEYPEIEENNQLALQRDENFFEANSAKIVELIQLLIKHVATSQSERDRKNLLDLIEEVWQHCERTFSKTTFAQLRLQLVVRFAFDDWENIRSKANNAICNLNIKFSSKVYEQAKVSIVSSVINVLQQKANTSDSLQTISHFLSILDRDQMRQLFKPERKEKDLLKRLRCALEMTIDVDLKRAVVCELNSQEQDMFACIPLKDTTKSECLDRILTALVKNGMGKKLFRSVGNSLRSKPNSKRIHSALILAHVSKVLTRENCDLYFTVLLRNHMTFVWLKHLERFIEQESDPSNSDPTETSSLWHTRESAFCCALLVAVAHSMRLMDPKRHDFQRLIVDVLYMILQFLPSTNMACASAAHVALEIIAKVCDQSVDEFLSENADKVVYKAAMQAKKLWKYPRSPFALSALLDRGYGRGMVDDLSSIIPEFLVGISTEDSARIVPCLKAMRSFVLALSEWFPELLQIKPNEQDESINDDSKVEQQALSDSESDEEEPGSSNDPHWQRLDKLRDKFEKLRQDNDNALKQKQEFQSMQFSTGDKRPEPPKLVKCVYRILERTQHLHHSPFPYTRLLLAYLLCDALRFIRQFDDQLLPMIHQNWVPMSISIRKTLRQSNQRTHSQTLSAPDKLIVAAELRTIACMCEVAGGFLYGKIVGELDELLQTFMQNSVKLSQRTAAVYSHSANFKLQAAVLECWPIYCTLAGIPVDRATQALKLYADDVQQNAKLREMATQGLDVIKKMPQKE